MPKINLQELLESLNDYLNIQDFKDYGPNGLQVRGKETIHKIVFSPSASLEIIEKTIQAKADVLIVHHGLFWDKDSRVLDGPLLQKVKKLIEHGISLLAYHLPLDAHKEVGNNFVTLNLLGAQKLQPFETIGAQGSLEISTSDFLHKVESFFGIKPVCPPYKKKQISKIATVSGGGHSYFKAACMQGIDAFITGTSDEWVWDYAQEMDALFIPLGHYKSETVGIKALKEYIDRRWGFETVLLESSNPY